MTLLGLVVVVVDLGSELHLLDDRVDLLLAVFTGLQGGFVLELAVVHELAHRRLGHGRNLDQVEISLPCQAQRIFDAHDADLLPVGPDKPDLGDADPLIDAGFDADGLSSVERVP